MLAFRINRIFGCLLLLLWASHGQAQEENNHWYFGGNAGLNFVITPATMPGQQTTYTTPLADGEVSSTVRSSVLSDSLGNLVLYSDGKEIWDRNHQTIPGADGLMGSGIDAETLIIPGPCGQFYLLYNQLTTNSNNLYYSLIDTSLNNGLGGIVPGQKNILLVPSGRHLAFNAIRSSGKYFLVVYQSDFNGRGRFLSYEMDADGQIPNPVISQTAEVDHWYMSMSLRASPNGRDLCLIKRNTTLNVGPAELFRIDLQGQISRTITLYPALRFQGYVRGIHEGAFSPDGTKFYAMERSTLFISPGTSDVSNRFSQYEISPDADSAKILSSRTTVLETPNTTNKIGRMGSMEVAKNGRIYIGQYLDNKLSVIEKPNLKGTACKFVLNSVPLANGTQGYERLPNALFAHYRVRPLEQEFRLRDTTFICDGDVISLSVDPSYDTQLWSNGSTSRNFDITEPGDYTVTVTKGGCVHQQHLYVDGTLKQDIVPEDEYVTCNATPIYFDVSDTAANAYLWSDGVTTPTRSLSEGGEYWVERTFDNCVYRDEFEIIAQPLAEDFWPEDTSVCVDTYFFLSANTFRGTYEWNTGETSANILVTEPGQYWVNIDALGCKASDTINVIHQLPPQPNLRDTVVCKGYPLTISAYRPDAIRYLWSNGDTGPNLRVEEEGTYTVEITNALCSGMDTVTIGFETCKPFAMYIPTAFTPNGDGRNEVFAPVPTAYAKILTYEVSIFNRWGRKVFTADDPDASWDGTMGGQPLPEGVYLCLVRIRVRELFGERSYTQQAQVSLLR